jgi:hypothetical protein
MWVEREGVGMWEWRWRRRLFVWEEALLASLLEVLPTVSITAEEDEWRWIIEEDGRFSVRSTYLLFDSVFSPEVLFGDKSFACLIAFGRVRPHLKWLLLCGNYCGIEYQQG